MPSKIWLYVAIALLGDSQALAQEPAVVVPQTRQQVQLSFSPVVKKVVPAVVNIYTRQRITVVDSPFMGDPFFEQFFGRSGVPGITFGGRPREQVVSSLGSGVIVSPQGMIVTSHHVIKDAQEITVVLSDKREFEAKVVLKDPKADLAFLSVKTERPLPALALRDSDTLEVGDLVLAIGNPFGVGQTVTSGIVSALARRAEGVSDYQFFIQTDAAINPGNSGGALVDLEGRLVGINTAIYSRSGGSQGIGFAIPANMVHALMEHKQDGGKVVRPWLGITAQPVTSEIADSLGLSSPQGVIVQALHAESPVAKAGIAVGDVILTLDGNPINGPEDLQYRLALAKVGTKGTFTLWHSGKQVEKSVEFIAPPESPARDVRTLFGKQPLSGLQVANLSPALALELGLDDRATGVVVVGRSEKVAGLDIGIGRGDIILEINGKPIKAVSQLAEVLAARTRGWVIRYQRGSQILTLNVRM